MRIILPSHIIEIIKINVYILLHTFAHVRTLSILTHKLLRSLYDVTKKCAISKNTCYYEHINFPIESIILKQINVCTSSHMFVYFSILSHNLLRSLCVNLATCALSRETYYFSTLIYILIEIIVLKLIHVYKLLYTFAHVYIFLYTLLKDSQYINKKCAILKEVNIYKHRY